MAKKDNRQSFGLECPDCKGRNYVTQKNTMEDKDKLVLKKYCKTCRIKTDHTEYKFK